MAANVKIVKDGVELYGSKIPETLLKEEFVYKLRYSKLEDRVMIVETLCMDTIFNILTSFKLCNLSYMDMYKVVNDIIKSCNIKDTLYRYEVTDDLNRTFKEVFTFKVYTLLKSLSNCRELSGSVDYIKPINDLFNEIDRIIG